MDLVDILVQVLEMGASDLHLTVGRPPVARVHGRLVELEYPPLKGVETRDLIYSVLTQDQRQRLETDWEIDFSYSVPARARFRVNAYFQRNSLGAAFRLVPLNVMTIDQLNLPRVVHTFCQKPRGFVLVTGPTGSGKSTTLAAIIDEVNETRSEHIMTVEDPIEFLHQHKNCVVNQREVGTDTKSFNRALKSVLRQDPDVILVGEIRDVETARIAIQAALTGHFVLSTIHATDATSALHRFLDMGIESFLLASSAGTDSRADCRLHPGHHDSATSTAGRRGGAGGGVRGLIPTPAVRNLIREGKTHQIYTIMQTGAKYGMQTMDWALADLVRRRLITRELAEARSSNPEDLNRLITSGAA